MCKKIELKIVCMSLALIMFIAILGAGTAVHAAEPSLSERQAQVHEAANTLRSLGFEDDHESIQALSQEWWKCEYEKNYSEEITYIAKTLYGECRGCSMTQQAAVAWCILNRADNWGMGIIDVITAPGQFGGYSPNHPVWSELYDLAQDVLARWRRESNGETDVGRVLPREYMWFSGNGRVNIFRNAYRGGSVWDWSWESPYD